MLNQAPKKAYLTISIDDGHPCDFRAAELLAKLGLKATFYVPAANPEREVIGAAGVRELSSAFEVGGHSMNHRSLTRLPLAEARREVVDCKRWIEDAQGRPARSFCYPQGRFNRAITRLVREAGFAGARTCMQNVVAAPADGFNWGVSTQAYSHGPLVQARHALKEGNLRGLANFFSIFRAAKDWETHFAHALETVAKRGGVAHLYFHSWEIDEQGQWEKLERALGHAASVPGLRKVTNGELFAP